MSRVLLTIPLAMLLATNARSRTLEELEKGIARTPPVSTPFIDFRFSHVFKKPVLSRGTLGYTADGVLTRTLTSPYHERTEVSGDEVRIQRADHPERRYSLVHVPQLRVVLGSFRALLDGRITSLSSDFNVSFKEDGERWTITLAPRDAKLQRFLTQIEVNGVNDQPACMEATEPDRDATLTWFSDVAPAATDRATLERLCRTGAQ